MSLVQYADLGFTFAKAYNYVWEFMNTNVSDALESIPNTPDALTNAVIDIFQFLVDITDPEVTVLGLILYFVGAGFMLFFAITFIKWALQLIK